MKVAVIASGVSKWTGGVLALLVAAGCDSRASEEYQGEVLFSVRGHVALTTPLIAPPWVPVTVFPLTTEAAEKTGLGEYGDVYVLREEVVTGEFPSAFRMDFLAPPPEEALQPTSSGGTLRVAGGVLAAATADHPDRLARFGVGDLSASSSWDECDADGRCIVTTTVGYGELEQHGEFACIDPSRADRPSPHAFEGCDALGLTGDPRRRAEAERREVGARCGLDGGCLAYDTYYCDDGVCYEENFLCSTLTKEQLDRLMPLWLTVSEIAEHCELLSTSGDDMPEVPQLDDYVAAASFHHSLLYVSEDVAFSELQDSLPLHDGPTGKGSLDFDKVWSAPDIVTAGYHLVRVEEPPEELRAERRLCVHEAKLAMYDEYERQVEIAEEKYSPIDPFEKWVANQSVDTSHCPVPELRYVWVTNPEEEDVNLGGDWLWSVPYIFTP